MHTKQIYFEFFGTPYYMYTKIFTTSKLIPIQIRRDCILFAMAEDLLHISFTNYLQLLYLCLRPCFSLRFKSLPGWSYLQLSSLS